jgi:hypothetical protein
MHRILSSILKESAMGFAASDVVPFTQARANLVASLFQENPATIWRREL